MTACLCHGTNTRLLAHPVGEGGVEDLNKDFPTSSLTHSSNSLHRNVPHLSAGTVKGASSTSSSFPGPVASFKGEFVFSYSFHDGRKLDILTADFLEE